MAAGQKPDRVEPQGVGLLNFLSSCRKALAAWRRRLVPASAETGLPPHGLPDLEGTSLVDFFQTYLKSQPLDIYYATHATRYSHTIERCEAALRGARQLLELGGHSFIGTFARDALGASLTEYGDDLRFPFKLPDSDFDVVLALEVLEHIKDSPLRDDSMEWISHFNFSGLQNVFTETFRVLKPGGLFLITTPNATSVDVLFKVVSAGHPHIFEPHVRELAPAEVFRLGAEARFELATFETFFSWTLAPEDFRRNALAYIEAAGFNPAHRGDDAYFEFRKPT